MRLIDADALKRKAQKVATEAWKMRIKASVETILNQFIDWINAQPTIKSEPQWIPCSERLPEEAGMYLITEQNYGFKVDAVCKNVLVHSSYFSVNEKEFQDTFYIPDCSNITAWMPLPEPYQEGADNG